MAGGIPVKSIKNILFFGTTSFSHKCLNHLMEDSQFAVQAIVTKPQQSSGRGMRLQPSPVYTLAKKMNIPVWTPSSLKDSSVLKPLQSFDISAVVVVDYGLILPPYLLKWFSDRVFNIHTSLLPRWRGAAPIVHCLLAGDQKTGVTLQKMVSRLDAGNIIYQLDFDISDQMNALDVLKKMEILSLQLLSQHLPLYLEREISPTSQDESQVTYAPKIDKSQLKINWSESSKNLFNKVRAMVIKNGVYTSYQGLRLKIWSAGYDDESHQEDFGKIILYNDKGLKVTCGQGHLYLKEVQLEGRKAQKIAPFLRGFSLKIGHILGQENATEH